MCIITTAAVSCPYLTDALDTKQFVIHLSHAAERIQIFFFLKEGKVLFFVVNGYHVPFRESSRKRKKNND